MTTIKPFKGILYNQEKIKDLSKVTCPPYDIIRPDEQGKYYANSPYNIIRLILGKSQPQDDEFENKYSRANNYLQDWIRKGILIRDIKPCIYFYEQEFIYGGTKKQRQGFISLMKLEYDGGSVFLHEHTHLQPKEDRLRLIRATKANLSPIFVLFEDKKQYIKKMHHFILNKAPMIEIRDQNDVIHRLWGITEDGVINNLKKYMESESIFIADGHHRYEVALAFREECFKIFKNAPQDADFNYIMTYFTDLNSSDIVIMPVHRLLKNIEKEKLDNLQNKLKDKFIIENIEDKEVFFNQRDKLDTSGHCLGLYFNKQFSILRLKDVELAKKIDIAQPLKFKLLDITIMNYLIFRDIFNLNLPDDEKILYVKDRKEAISLVDNKDADIGFFLNPIRIDELVDIASLGKRMPPKSTYFYPKLLSGLVVNKFKDS